MGKGHRQRHGRLPPREGGAAASAGALADPEDDPPAREGVDYAVPPRTDGLIGVAALAADAAERAHGIGRDGGAA